MARQFGPNDHHYETVGGVLTLMPGLGTDEPDDVTKDRVRAAAEANKLREEALERAAQEMAKEAEILEQKEADLEERERRIEETERRLRQLEAQLATQSAPDAQRRSTARQATERG